MGQAETQVVEPCMTLAPKWGAGPTRYGGEWPGDAGKTAKNFTVIAVCPYYKIYPLAGWPPGGPRLP